MIAPQFKTRAEQKLEWLESLRRPLTDEESRELHRCLHAVYERNRRYAAMVERQNHAGAIAEHDRDNAALLSRMEAEMRG